MEFWMPRVSKFSFAQTWVLLFGIVLMLLGAGMLARAGASPIHTPNLVLLADAVIVPLDAGTLELDAGVPPLEGSEPAEVGPTALPTTMPKGIPTNIDSLDAWGQFGMLAYRAVQSKDWQFLVGLVLILVMLGLRKLASYVKEHKEGWKGSLASFLDTSFGGTFLLFTTAMLGALGSTQLAHVPFTWWLVFDVAKMALLAAGGWHAIVKPFVEFVQARWKAPVVGSPVEPPKP